MLSPTTILQFWFGDDVASDPIRNAEQWYKKDAKFDLTVSEKFKDTLAQAKNGLEDWKQSPEGTLALIILTDQFPRNIFRNQKTAFSFDSIALTAAKEGMQKEFDRRLSWIERTFFYLPFEHSENLQDQEKSISCFEKLLQETPPKYNDYAAEAFEYAVRHWEIIKRFGRFPHRNDILKRPSTQDELEFLQQPGSSF